MLINKIKIKPSKLFYLLHNCFLSYVIFITWIMNILKPPQGGFCVCIVLFCPCWKPYGRSSFTWGGWGVINLFPCNMQREIPMYICPTFVQH